MATAVPEVSVPSNLIEATVAQMDKLYDTRQFDVWLQKVSTAMFDDVELVSAKAPSVPNALYVERSLPAVEVLPKSRQVTENDVARVQAGLRALLSLARDQRCLEEIVELGTVANLPEVAERVTSLVRLLSGSTAGVFWTIESDDLWMVPSATSGTARHQKLGLKIGEGFAGLAAQTGLPVSTTNLAKGLTDDGQKVSARHDKTVKARGWRAAHFEPIPGATSTAGVVAVYSNLARPYGGVVVLRMRALCAVLGHALRADSALRGAKLLEDANDNLRLSSQYYKKKLRDTHDAGKSLTSIAADVLTLRPSPNQHLDDAEGRRAVTPQQVHDRLSATSSRIQNSVRADLPADVGERFRRSKLDLGMLANSIATEMARSVEGERIDFHPSGLSARAPVLGDRGALTDCLNNLIDNALYFVRYDGKPGRRTITVRLTQDDEYVHLSVEDDGLGIEPRHLPDGIFQLGYTTKVDDGAGLGLASVKRIVELHEGSLSVDTKWGFGSTFTVTLRRAPD